MSTIEKLFVQIFEQKKCIIEKLKHQKQLYDQHLASKLLIEGITPPPWLLNSEFPSLTSDLSELKKEELISGLLLPRPRPLVTYFNDPCCLYNKPVAAANPEPLDDLCAGTSTSSKCLDENCSGFPPLCPVRGSEHTLNHVTVTPQDRTDAGITVIYSEPDQSLARIQRSRSRQKALELRNSAKANAKSSLGREIDPGDCFSDTAQKICSGLPNCLNEFLELAKPSANTVENGSIKEAELREHLCKEKNTDVCSASVPGSGCQEVKDAETGHYLSKEKKNVCSDRITRSRSLYQQSIVGDHQINENNQAYGSMITRTRTSESKQAETEYKHSREKIEYCNSEKIARRAKAHPRSVTGDHHSYEKGGKRYSGRVTRSRSHAARQAEKGGCRSKEINDSVFNGTTTQSTGSCSQAESMKPIGFSNIAKENGCAWSQSMDKTLHLQLEMLDAADLQNNLDAQVIARDSVSSQNDAKVCTEDMRELSAKNEVLLQHIDIVRSSQTDHSSQDRSEPVNSSNDLGLRVTWPVSSSNPSPARSLRELKHNSTMLTEVDALHCTEACGTIDQEKCVVDAARTGLLSGKLVESYTVDLGSNMDDSRLGKGLDASVCSPLLLSGMLVKPMQLDFDEIEESCLCEVPDSIERTIQHSESAGSSVLGCDESPEKLSSHVLHGKLDSVPQESLLVQQVMSSRKEASRSFSGKEWSVLSTGNVALIAKGKFDCDPSHAPSSCKTSKICDLSLINEHPIFGLDEVGYTIPESKRISELNTSFLQVSQEDLQGRGKAADPNFRNLQTGMQINLSFQKHVRETEGGKSPVEEIAICSLPKVDVDPVSSLSSEKHSGQLAAKQPAVAFSEKFKLGPSSYEDCKLTDPKVAEFGHFTCCSRTVGSQGTPALEYSPVISDNETKCKFTWKEIDASTSVAQNAEQYWPHFLIDRMVAGGSKVTEARSVGKSMLPEYGFNSGMEGPWPQYKRRKIESPILNYRSASPSFRVNHFPEVSDFQNRSHVRKHHSTFLPSQFSMCHNLDVAQSRSSYDSMTEMQMNAKCSVTKSTPKLLDKEGAVSLEGRGVMIPLTLRQQHLERTSMPSLIKQATVVPQSCFLEEGNVNPATGVPDGQYDDSLHIEDKAVASIGENLASSQMTLDQREFLHEDDQMDCSVVSPKMEYMAEVGPDQTISVFEGFNIDVERVNEKIAGGVGFDGNHLPNDTIDRASFLEQLCKSVTSCTPLSHFPTAYKPHGMPSTYYSLPNGLLEQIDLRSKLPLNGSADQQLKAGYLCMNDDNSCSLSGKSCSDCLPLPSSGFGWGFRKPYLSPVRKGFEGISSKSGSSDKHASSIPKLTCFPIEEDPESSDEKNTNANDVAEACAEENGSSVGKRSVKGDPPCDFTAEHISTLASDSGRGCLESVSTETSANEMQNRASQRNLNHHSRTRHTNSGKENISLGANSIKKHSETLNSRFPKPQLSGKTSMRSESQSFSEKELKRNNIVSNLKSFLPLVQQKQAAAIAPVKRDVRVKALEAAEAAKRLAEKRENERKQKKEALKLERVKLEQENLRQLELKTKLKEEERRKKDADIAARKRQRDEEERKERERKRKRIEEARRLQREQEEKVHAEIKEYKYGAAGKRADNRKEFNEEKEKHAVREMEENSSIEPVDELSAAGVSQWDVGVMSANGHKASTVSCDTGKVPGNNRAGSSTPNYVKDNFPSTKISQEQSYQMSPYQCSDDEEEEEDDKPIKKIIPTWASKSCVALALSASQKLDPDVIFPPGSFCSLDEVLLPRKLLQKSSAG
ncbi:hypothetical protein Nepgr_007663 [Nepenthes gracilis]|uniref:Inner centromere protein ARK-binding domain-containing protein n=1 Tax=Nepenthes gracilis TaxID=150966 RepID=A0AAD3S7A7_NEPGR|nr:hypothetical protein Nepgr_007663 [Nepenthes gracilis]